MINECNILIYSIFIFFCYSFVILNMALPLFHTVKPLNYLVCFESVVLWPGAFLPYGQRLPHLRHLPRILYRKRCGRRLLRVLRIKRVRTEVCVPPASVASCADGGGTAGRELSAGRSAKILISFHICIGSLSDDEKYCSGLGAVCGAGVYYRERSGRPLVSVRKFLFPIRCFSEYFYFLCINH